MVVVQKIAPYRLLELEWWNLEEDVIRQIPYDNIEKAIGFIKCKGIKHL